MPACLLAGALEWMPPMPCMRTDLTTCWCCVCWSVLLGLTLYYSESESRRELVVCLRPAVFGFSFVCFSLLVD